MAIVSPAQIVDGTTIDAADVNNPINTLANEFNGNIDNNNIKSNASIDAAKLADSSITSTKLDISIRPDTRWGESFQNYVASGCTWSADSPGVNRNASMLAGVVYIGGKRLTINAVANRTFTASKDTYIDIDSSGNIVYTEVLNNAASPTLVSGYLRLAIIVTGATSIAASTSINQGELERTLPSTCNVYKSGQDSLGNIIGNKVPNPTLILLKTFGILTIGSTSYRDMATITATLPFRCKLYIFGTFSGRPQAAPAFSIYQNLVLDGITSLENRLDSSVNTVTSTLTGEICATMQANTSFTVRIQDKMNSGGIEPFHGAIRITAIPY
jgi:hypothetical protein